METLLTLSSITADQKKFFDLNGYLLIESILTQQEVAEYRTIYDRFLSGEIDCRESRYDLGGHAEKKRKGVENETQIMRPCDLLPSLAHMAYHERALAIARDLIGSDAEFDFDMMIDKGPRTATATPWHQDAAYWIQLADSRAASVWLALDEATLDNGCMWYVPGSHLKPLRMHRKAGKDGIALECDATENEGVAVPIKPGSCVFHHGGTLHYSRGNTTDSHRRAFIINYRPRAMVEYERSLGVTHGSNKKTNPVVTK